MDDLFQIISVILLYTGLIISGGVGVIQIDTKFQDFVTFFDHKVIEIFKIKLLFWLYSLSFFLFFLFIIAPIYGNLLLIKETFKVAFTRMDK